MKKIILFFIIILACNFMLPAQKLTVEYNFGYGKFCMRDLRHFLADVNPLNSRYELDNIKLTDNFPGNRTHQLKLGVEIKRSHNIGVSVDFMNTAGQKALSDYSGSYNFTYRTKGNRFGLFYRVSPYSWFPGVVQPYFMLTGGVVLTDNRIVESFIVYDESILDERMYMKGGSLFVEPALGCKIRLHDYFALNLNVGYHFDLGDLSEYDVSYVSANNHGLPLWSSDAHNMPTWGGLRFQGGLIFYVPLSKK